MVDESLTDMFLVKKNVTSSVHDVRSTRRPCWVLSHHMTVIYGLDF